MFYAAISLLDIVRLTYDVQSCVKVKLLYPGRSCFDIKTCWVIDVRLIKCFNDIRNVSAWNSAFVSECYLL
jgi:hypothetical protein